MVPSVQRYTQDLRLVHGEEALTRIRFPVKLPAAHHVEPRIAEGRQALNVKLDTNGLRMRRLEVEPVRPCSEDRQYLKPNHPDSVRSWVGK